MLFNISIDQKQLKASQIVKHTSILECLRLKIAWSLILYKHASKKSGIVKLSESPAIRPIIGMIISKDWINIVNIKLFSGIFYLSLDMQSTAMTS